MLHLTVRADYGGAPNYIDTMINNYSIEDFEYYIACPKDKPFYKKWEENKRVQEVCLVPHRRFSFSALFNLCSFIKKNDIKLIQANGKGAGLYARLLKIFYPKVKVIYAYRGFHIRKYNRIQLVIYIAYEKIASWFTDKVINVSVGEQSTCLKHGVLTKALSTVIYNGIPPIIKAPNKEFIDKYSKTFNVVTLSRFDIQKNMWVMYDIAKAFKNNPGVRFLFIGDGPDKASIQKKAEKEGLTIDFLGFQNREQIGEFLAISNLYLSTALWEGLPFALIEAASAELPIVASDVIGNNEVCIDNKNGFLFDSETPLSAVALIEEIISDTKLREKFSSESSALYKQKFTVDKMLHNHEKLYFSLLHDL